jgi:hypothetical protein
MKTSNDCAVTYKPSDGAGCLKGLTSYGTSELVQLMKSYGPICASQIGCAMRYPHFKKQLGAESGTREPPMGGSQMDGLQWAVVRTINAMSAGKYSDCVCRDYLLVLVSAAEPRGSTVWHVPCPRRAQPKEPEINRAHHRCRSPNPRMADKYFSEYCYCTALNAFTTIIPNHKPQYAQISSAVLLAPGQRHFRFYFCQSDDCTSHQTRTHRLPTDDVVGCSSQFETFSHPSIHFLLWVRVTDMSDIVP